jgi:hypothetical protein
MVPRATKPCGHHMAAGVVGCSSMAYRRSPAWLDRLCWLCSRGAHERADGSGDNLARGGA